MLLLEERGSEVGREGEGFEFWKKGGVWGDARPAGDGNSAPDRRPSANLREGSRYNKEQ